MAPKLSNIEGVRKALRESHGQPVEIEDDQTHMVYVMVTREEFQTRYQPVFDDSDPNPREFYKLFAEAVRDDIDAPGMEDYDNNYKSRTNA